METDNGAIDAIRTPPRGFAPLGAVLSGRAIPHALARLGIRLARRSDKPWRLFGRIIVARHGQVDEALRRDLDFLIAPVNAKKIRAVNGPFVLGMDRSAALQSQRKALYSALDSVDFTAIGERTEVRATKLLRERSGAFDAIADYARPVAVGTAMDIFGIAPKDRALFAEVARAIFAHTFLNLGDDRAIAQRAERASQFLQRWLESEIARRRRTGETGNDLMSQLLAHAQIKDEEIRRVLGGMLVGSIDTTVTAFAKILTVVCADADLKQAVHMPGLSDSALYGLCLEALRRWPHNPILLREAAADTSLAGTSIKKGERVFLWTQAAMLDSDAFPDPKRPISDRPQRNYLHFGAGLHPCAGRRLNAIQLPILVRSILPRLVRGPGRIGWAGPFPDCLTVRLGEAA